MERFQAVAGATQGYGSAAMTKGSTCKRGVKCVPANTHGMFHARTERRHMQLARGIGITPQAPGVGRPGSASRNTTPDCRAGCGMVQDCVHRRVIKKIEPQRHARGRWLWRSSQQKMSKGVKCVYAAMYLRATCKQTTERNSGQQWKPYRGSRCRNWQSSPTHSTCN